MRTITSVEKGMKILEIVAASPEGVRVKDIAAAMGIPSSNITLFLNALVKSGMVTHDVSFGRYVAGTKLVDLGRMAQLTKYATLTRIARPHMRALRDELEENVLLAVLSGQDVRFVERFQSTRSVQILHNADVSFPPHVTAAGKAILAYFDEKAKRKYLDDALYHGFTERSITDPESLAAELAEIRRTGIAVNYGEFEPEVMAIAAPIRDADGVCGSLVVQFPTFRYQESDLGGFTDRVQSTAKRIEGSMGITPTEHR